jgi:NADH-quinone oxidoreductase subunit G/NADP-reducing hydrogenase subunit HndD
MKMINLLIDNREVSVPEGTTILEAARKLGIKIPTLCHFEDQEAKANCRICSVQLRGRDKMYTACSTPVWEGMDIVTNNKKVREIRKTILELILANHPQDCLSCTRNGNCELQTLAAEYNVREMPFEKGELNLPIDNCNASIVRDPNKCIKCGRCVDACHKVQGIKAINYSFRSGKYTIAPPFGKTLDQTECIYCGQCITACPVGALSEKEDIDRVWDAIHDSEVHVLAQPAPAVRVALGEEFGLEAGSIVTGKLAAALRRVGFDKVFDTNFAADLTIMEEGNELIHRIKTGGTIPMMTSCCPGWINFVEKHYPEVIPNLSTCKSPHQMFGAIAKSYYAEKMGVDPKKIFVVSVMPCTAKKGESAREEMNNNGLRDVDAVITTRELAKMLKEVNLDFNTLKPENFDSPLGESTGAAAIFGATGGVMEAALRTAYEVITGEELKELDFTDVRGMEGIKEAEVELSLKNIDSCKEAAADLDGDKKSAGTLKLKVAVANGIKNARVICEKIKNGECDYQFIEVMTCVSGCVGGGGQPLGGSKVKQNRLEAIYVEDANKSIRKSHENPDIIKLYDEFLEKPLGGKSHNLLHTNYTARK